MKFFCFSECFNTIFIYYITISAQYIKSSVNDKNDVAYISFQTIAKIQQKMVVEFGVKCLINGWKS